MFLLSELRFIYNVYPDYVGVSPSTRHPGKMSDELLVHVKSRARFVENEMDSDVVRAVSVPRCSMLIAGSELVYLKINDCVCGYNLSVMEVTW